jgi:hypothetical protein
VVAGAQTDNYAAALDSSFATGAGNFVADAIRNSVADVTDNCAAVQSNCVPAATDIGAGLQAGWILVAGVALDAWVVTGWVPGGKDVVENRCDDSAPSTASPPKPAS